MAKTQSQYQKEIYNAGKVSIDRQLAARKKTDANTIAQINKSIDAATKTATDPYKQQIADAPVESRKLYDENAVKDAVNRKLVQEKLINSGATDSGLNSSMQTAMTIQKSKADSAVKSQELQKIQAAQSAIDQIVADSAAKKAENKINIERSTSDWYTGVLAQLESDSQTAAANAYAADREYEAKTAAAQTEAANNLQKQRLEYVQYMMKNKDYDEDRAWAAAYKLYPTGNASMDNYYAAIAAGYSPEQARAYANAGGGNAGTKAVYAAAVSKVQNAAKHFTFDMTGDLLGENVGKTGKKGATKAANKMLTQINNSSVYKSMTAAEKEVFLAYAAGQMVASTWPKDTDKNKNELANRLSTACSILGADYDSAESFYKKAISWKRANM